MISIVITNNGAIPSENTDPLTPVIVESSLTGIVTTIEAGSCFGWKIEDGEVITLKGG